MKKNFQSTPSTAYKRQLAFESNDKIQYSPNLLTPSQRRKASKLNSRRSMLKDLLDQLISNTSDKGSIQNTAIQRVWDVNSELVNYLSNSQQLPRIMSTNSLRPENNKDLNRTTAFGDTSSFIEQKSASLIGNDQEEVFKLKQAINNQARISNELMHELKALQNEHESLLQQSNHRLDTASLDLSDQNQRLRNQLNKLNNQTSMRYSYEDLWRELGQLKEQNQKLRQQTIALLKSEGGKIEVQRLGKVYAY